MSRTDRNFQRMLETVDHGAVTRNLLAQEMLRNMPRDTNRRTLPHVIPGSTVDAQGRPIPTDQQTPQVFEDNEWIVVDNVVGRRLQEFHVHNRRKSEANVQFIMGQILSGRWVPNVVSNTLSFSNEHGLNGQHRIDAVVRIFEDPAIDQSLKIPMLFRVELGLPSNAFDVMDGALRRTLADTIYCNNAVGAIDIKAVPDKLMATAARILTQYLNNTQSIDPNSPVFLRTERARLQNSCAVPVIQMYPELVVSAAFVHGIKGLTDVVKPHAMTVAHMLISEMQSASAANTFTRALVSGADLDADSPILYVRNLFANAARRQRRMEGLEMLAFILRAWNLYAEGRVMTRGWKSFNADGTVPTPRKFSRQRSHV